MSSRTTSRATRRRTSSRALADGPSLFDWAAGLTTGQSGPVPVPASPSPPPANDAAPMTNGTCGPSSAASSRSAALQSSLESRLRQRLDGIGSPLFVLTWKHWDMPSGPPICAVRASAPRTSGSACGGWPTPDTGREESLESFQRRVERMKERHPEKGGMGSTGPLHIAAQLAGWPTPRVGNNGGHGNADRAMDGTNSRIEDTAQLVAPGPTSTGSPAAMEKPGQLNPAHSRWLMGYPAAWDSCGATAMQSIRTSRRSSSVRSSTSKPE